MADSPILRPGSWFQLNEYLTSKDKTLYKSIQSIAVKNCSCGGEWKPEKNGNGGEFIDENKDDHLVLITCLPDYNHSEMETHISQLCINVFHQAIVKGKMKKKLITTINVMKELVTDKTKGGTGIAISRYGRSKRLGKTTPIKNKGDLNVLKLLKEVVNSLTIRTWPMEQNSENIIE